MSLTKEQISIEKKYLNKVIQVFDDKFNDEIEQKANIEERARNLKKYLSDNKNQMDGGEISVLRQAIERLVGTGDVVDKKYQLLKKASKAPYFARIDFQDFVYDELLEMYIGLTSIHKEGDDKYLVYDWRSPAASMYYEEGIGNVSYKAPAGTITGEITLKRQYKIEDRKLEYVFDNSINIDDELLKEALVKNTSAKMKNIVNSIQKEQNMVIRNVNDEVLIIDGPAGSGKTSVALHRIAFLLYRERENLKAENIVILSPNEVFSEYISSVLPELGEDNVEYLTFAEYYSDNLKDNKTIQTFNDYIKNIYEEKDILAKESFALKSSPIFKIMLDDYYKKIESSIRFKDITYKEKTALSKQEFELLYNKKYKKFKLQERIENIINKASLNIYDNLSLYERSKTTINKVRKVIKPQIKMNLNAEVLYKSMLKDVQFVDKYIKKTNIRSSTRLICNNILTKLKDKVLLYDDLIAINYLKLLTTEITVEEDVKHIVIDEAQDYSILQYEVIKNTFKKAKFTILGDVNQAINPYLKYKDFNQVEKVFDNKKVKPFSLINCYRNSFEISNFANALLNLNNVKAVNRYEGLPIIYKDISKEKIIKNIKQNIKEMRDKGFKQIGVICKTSNQAKKLYQELQNEIENINYIDFSSGNYEEGVSVLSSYTSKGLEFDAVIAVNYKDGYIKSNEKNLLYVVFTRALHQLIIYNEDNELGLLENISKNLYELKKHK